MAIQQKIKINKSGTGVTYDPAVLKVRLGDQIFWINNDDKPHWPGLLNADGTINKTFFMPNQIASGSTSTTFSPGRDNEALNYACSLHRGESGGQIIVGNPPKKSAFAGQTYPKKSAFAGQTYRGLRSSEIK